MRDSTAKHILDLFHKKMYRNDDNQIDEIVDGDSKQESIGVIWQGVFGMFHRDYEEPVFSILRRIQNDRN